MANRIPFTGGSEAGGGYLLPPEQGQILVQGVLVETGAIQLAGDARATTARKTNFPIWLGKPVAGFVSEGANKPATGAAFAQATLNIKKCAAIVIFTDEMLQDLQNGDLSVLVDAGVRQALSVAIDSNAVGLVGGALISGGTAFAASDVGETVAASLLTQTGGNTSAITIANTTKTNGVQVAVSEALGVLEENGYGNPADIGILLGFGFQSVLRNVRDGYERPVYDGGTFAGQSIDALYGLDRAHSTNLPALNHATANVTLELVTASLKAKIKAGKRGTVPLFVGQPVIAPTLYAAGTYIKALVGNAGVETEVEFSTKPLKEEEVAVKLGLPVAVAFHKPNVHVRIREDVVLKTSNEASITTTTAGLEGEPPTEAVSLFQANLTAVLYETRIGYLIHDSERAVVPLWF